jgi:8-oxo-dGTP pyrophosphatase MutT (NUDIX family)
MELLDQIKRALSSPLPGEEAHVQIMSYNRAIADDARKMDPPPRESAVMMLLFMRSNSLHTLFIQRQDYDGAHSGQISFPGGKLEKYDENLLDAALRETEEEIGLISERIEVLGALSDIYIPPSHFLVKPYVGWVENMTALTPDPKEVKDILIEPIENLFTVQQLKQKKIFIPKFERELNVPYFDVQGRPLWGATAMMVFELKYALQKMNAI